MGEGDSWVEKGFLVSRRREIRRSRIRGRAWKGGGGACAGLAERQAGMRLTSTPRRGFSYNYSHALLLLGVCGWMVGFLEKVAPEDQQFEFWEWCGCDS